VVTLRALLAVSGRPWPGRVALVRLKCLARAMRRIRMTSPSSIPRAACHAMHGTHQRQAGTPLATPLPPLGAQRLGWLPPASFGQDQVGVRCRHALPREVEGRGVPGVRPAPRLRGVPSVPAAARAAQHTPLCERESGQAGTHHHQLWRKREKAGTLHSATAPRPAAHPAHLNGGSPWLVEGPPTTWPSSCSASLRLVTYDSTSGAQPSKSEAAATYLRQHRQREIIHS
jgi:hypothetical protein